jgi:hypothetical protein
MRRAITLGVLLLGAALTGCIGTDDQDQVESASTPADVDELVSVAELNPVTTDDPVHAAHANATLPTINDPTANLAVDEVPTWWQPPEPAEVPDAIETVEHDTTLHDGENRGAGFAIFGSLMILPSWTHNTTIYDISDPQNPERLADLPDPPARAAHPKAFDDGRLYAVFATEGSGIPIFNLTDPENPTKVATIQPDRTSHNVEILPGTPYLYNSASNGGGPGSQAPSQASEGTAIYDLSDPSEPEKVTDWDNGYACHDIKFGMWPEDDKHRAYCAGHEVTQIWNVDDPTDPEVIVNVPAHHGNPDLPAAAAAPAAFSHLAMPNSDGTVLIVGDETGGGVSPGCDVYAEAGDTTASGPTGNLWFYDISDEENPELQGWISPSNHYEQNPPHNDRWTPYADAEVPPGCTAHFGHLLPQEGKLAMAFYGAGVLLVDFTDPANPTIQDRWVQDEEPGTNVWDVWYYQGYLFTGDLARTGDVLTLG